MASVNRVILVGNVGHINKKVTDNCTLLNVSLATNEGHKDPNTGQFVKQTLWHDLTAFNSIARYIDNYVQKGDKLYIEGKLQSSKYTDKNNQTRTRTEVIVKVVQNLTQRKKEHSDEELVFLPISDDNVSDDLHYNSNTTLSNDYF